VDDDERQEHLRADRARRAAARDAAAEFQEAFTEAAAALARTLQPFMLAAVKMFQALANDPVVRFAMEHPELFSGEQPQPCHCLCGRSHPADMSVCDMEAVTTRRYVTEAMGTVDVALCAPCAVAQGLTELSGPPA
jgi:hypothetical protein